MNNNNNNNNNMNSNNKDMNNNNTTKCKCLSSAGCVIVRSLKCFSLNTHSPTLRCTAHTPSVYVTASFVVTSFPVPSTGLGVNLSVWSL